MSINFNVYFWECLLGIIIFSFAILVPLYMNPLWWIHDYPKDIQERYFENHDRIPTEPFSIVVLIKKGCALILALGVLVGLVALAGATSFLSGFLLSYGIWFLIDWYDCFVLDWIFFANIKKIRIPGTEDMDEAYHQKKYHFVHSCIGMALGLIPCILCGAIIALIY